MAKVDVSKFDIAKLDSDILAIVDKDLTLADWTLFGEKEGVKMYENLKAHPTLKALMGIITLPYSANKAAKALQGFDHVKHYDDKFKSGEIVAQLDENHCILHARYISGSFFVGDRDFVFLESRIEKDGKIYILDQSLDIKEVPEQGATRGWLHYAGWIVKHLEDQKCELYYLGLVDPKGLIPHAIVSSVGGEEIMVVFNVKKYLTNLKD